MSAAPSLGPYVQARPRADGTHNVLFVAPKRDRLPGWPATVCLPRGGERRGNLRDAAEVARIRSDAARLLADYRARTAPAQDDYSLAALVRAWQSTARFRRCAEVTRRGYNWTAAEVTRAWPGCDPRSVAKTQVEAFLRAYEDRPTLAIKIRACLSELMEQAIDAKWRTDNPVDRIRLEQPVSRATIWEAVDVEQYAWAAVCAGQPGLAALILTGWEIGQRLTDLIALRAGASYEPATGVFRFAQSKTGAYVTIPVSARLRAILAASTDPKTCALFTDAATGLPFADVGRLGHVFQGVRERFVQPADGRRVILRCLRHSCVVQLARAGCTVPQIAAITGHSLSSVTSILSCYLPRDSEVAWEAQRRRGLVD